MAAVRFSSVRWPAAAGREADEIKKPRSELVSVPFGDSRLAVRGDARLNASPWPTGLRPQVPCPPTSRAIEPTCREVTYTPVMWSVATAGEKENLPVAVQYPVLSMPAGKPTAAGSQPAASRALVVERTDRASVAAGGATDVLRASPTFGPEH